MVQKVFESLKSDCVRVIEVRLIRIKILDRRMDRHFFGQKKIMMANLEHNPVVQSQSLRYLNDILTDYVLILKFEHDDLIM